VSTESELRDLFGRAAPALPDIDLDRVLRRATLRRRGRQVTLGGATALAIVGIGIAGITGIRGSVPSTTSGAASSAGAPDSSGRAGESPNAPIASNGPIAGAPAETIDRCGGPLARAARNASGLVLSAAFAPADSASGRISGTVTLTNTGSERVFGSSPASPVITLSQHGVVLWHSNGPAPAMAALVDLAPGASLSYQAWFEPLRCAAEDDSAGAFRSDLPHVSPGVYEVSAKIEITRQSPDGSFPAREVVTGPTSEVTLR
jgi:hypothetical protein